MQQITQITTVETMSTVDLAFTQLAQWFKSKIHTQINELLATNPKLLILSNQETTAFDAYINSFGDPVIKQSYNCRTCKNFFNGVGSIVYIDPELELKPFGLADYKDDSIFDTIPDSMIKSAYMAVYDFVKTAKTVSIFTKETFDLRSDKYFGFEYTGDWSHFAVNKDTQKNLIEYIKTSVPSVEKAGHGYGRSELTHLNNFFDEVALVFNGKLLPRSELRTREMSTWDELCKWVDGVKEQRTNLMRLELITNGLSKLSVRGGPLGQLIQWLANGEETQVAFNKYYGMCSPLKYKRTTRAPSGLEFEKSVAFLEQNGYDKFLPKKLLSINDYALYPDFLYWTPKKEVISDSETTSIFAKQRKIIEANKTKVKEEPVATNELRTSINFFVETFLPNIELIDISIEKMYHYNSFVAGAMVHNTEPNSGSMYKDGKAVQPFSFHELQNQYSRAVRINDTTVQGLYVNKVPYGEFHSYQLAVILENMEFITEIPMPIFADSLINDLQQHSRTIDNWCSLNKLNVNDNGEIVNDEKQTGFLMLSINNTFTITYRDNGGTLIKRDIILTSVN